MKVRALVKLGNIQIPDVQHSTVRRPSFVLS